MWNFAVKFLLDQTIAGVCNILLFIVLINLLKGSNLGRVWELVCEVCYLLSFFSAFW